MTTNPTLPRSAIPPDAMPVVLVLRKEVPKPDLTTLGNNTTGKICTLHRKCPMGLHPKSRFSFPITGKDFAGGQVCSGTNVLRFRVFWDALTLPEAKQAVDLIWPKEGSDVS